MARPRRVPRRRSLLVRLLATSVLIAVSSIAVTAWLAVQSTTRAIQQAQGQALSDDARSYDLLVGYAATHPSWDGVEQVVRDLSRQTGRQIALTTTDRNLLAGSTKPLPDKASAVVDPLQTDPALQAGTSDRIDPRAVGPYALLPAEREVQRQTAANLARCLEAHGYPVQTVETPSGRMSLDLGDHDDPAEMVRCGAGGLAALTPTERRAKEQLSVLVDDCLGRRGLPAVQLPELADGPFPVSQAGVGSEQVQACLDAGRREQLRPYVAPAALLFILGPDGVTPAGFNLSRANVMRIIGVTALALVVTIAVTTLVGARLVRPLRALTAAALNPAEYNHRMPYAGRDEIGVLAAALNDLSERRERAENRRKAMVSDVAHELRTPLTNIRSWLEAAEDGLATPASDPALTAALLREVLQLQHIINDLQDLAAADAGGLRLYPQLVHLGDILDQVVTAHSGSAEAAGVTLTADTTDDPALTVDPVRLRQALGNLVSNAIRYTPAGGHVTLGGRADGEHIVISIADTGVGIAATDLPHVFDRFWRADPSRSRDTGGSGLGLAIVRQIAETHSGSVTATSTVGLGSTFTLQIPQR